MNDTGQFPLPGDQMPPLPKAGEFGSLTCSTVRFYLAILDDLPPGQVQLLLDHVRNCPDCTAVHHQMRQTTHMLAGLPESAPSPRVDQAIKAAITARNNRQAPANIIGHQDHLPTPASPYPKKTKKRTRSIVGAPLARALGASPPAGTLGASSPAGALRVTRLASALGGVALAAVLLLALLTTMHFLGGTTTPQAFALPANLSWNGYVLYQSETRIDDKGERYQVDCYYDLDTGHMHVETIMPDSLDVVAVSAGQEVLGLDMMHHVAQWGAKAWSVDESVFNLAQLRSDMATHRAVYLDEDMFHDQPVYRIRTSNGLVLLLDMHYRPVNVLRGAVGPGTGAPIYDALVLMPASHVSSSMWNMSVPPGFRMGTLPEKP